MTKQDRISKIAKLLGVEHTSLEAFYAALSTAISKRQPGNQLDSVTAQTLAAEWLLTGDAPEDICVALKRQQGPAVVFELLDGLLAYLTPKANTELKSEVDHDALARQLSCANLSANDIEQCAKMLLSNDEIWQQCLKHIEIETKWTAKRRIKTALKLMTPRVKISSLRADRLWQLDIGQKYGWVKIKSYLSDELIAENTAYKALSQDRLTQFVACVRDTFLKRYLANTRKTVEPNLTRALAIKGILLAQSLSSFNTRTLFIDSHEKSGLKCIAVEASGQYLGHSILYVGGEHAQIPAATRKFQAFLSQHKIEAIVIGGEPNAATQFIQNFFANQEGDAEKIPPMHYLPSGFGQGDFSVSPEWPVALADPQWQAVSNMVHAIMATTADDCAIDILHIAPGSHFLMHSALQKNWQALQSLQAFWQASQNLHQTLQQAFITKLDYKGLILQVGSGERVYIPYNTLPQALNVSSNLLWEIGEALPIIVTSNTATDNELKIAKLWLPGWLKPYKRRTTEAKKPAKKPKRSVKKEKSDNPAMLDAWKAALDKQKSI